MGRSGWSQWEFFHPLIPCPEVDAGDRGRDSVCTAWPDWLRPLFPLLPSSRREFARWKVNNLALERKDFFSLPLPLAPEFIRNIRLLGRRPSAQQITDSLIKKYGTHFLLAATLGGECWWVLAPCSLPLLKAACRGRRVGK